MAFRTLEVYVGLELLVWNSLFFESRAGAGRLKKYGTHLKLLFISSYTIVYPPPPTLKVQAPVV